MSADQFTVPQCGYSHHLAVTVNMFWTVFIVQVIYYSVSKPTSWAIIIQDLVQDDD